MLCGVILWFFNSLQNDTAKTLFFLNPPSRGFVARAVAIPLLVVAIVRAAGIRLPGMVMVVVVVV
jgi:hypothetical protein